MTFTVFIWPQISLFLQHFCCGAFWPTSLPDASGDVPQGLWQVLDDRGRLLGLRVGMREGVFVSYFHNMTTLIKTWANQHNYFAINTEDVGFFWRFDSTGGWFPFIQINLPFSPMMVQWKLWNHWKETIILKISSLKLTARSVSKSCVESCFVSYKRSSFLKLLIIWILTDAGGAVAAGSSKDTLMKVKTESVRDGWVHKAIFSLILSTNLLIGFYTSQVVQDFFHQQ